MTAWCTDKAHRAVKRCTDISEEQTDGDYRYYRCPEIRKDIGLNMNTVYVLIYADSYKSGCMVILYTSVPVSAIVVIDASSP